MASFFFSLKVKLRQICIHTHKDTHKKSLYSKCSSTPPSFINLRVVQDQKTNDFILHVLELKLRVIKAKASHSPTNILTPLCFSHSPALSCYFSLTHSHLPPPPSSLQLQFIRFTGRREPEDTLPELKQHQM